MRHADIPYAAFDLEQFVEAPRSGATAADVELGRQVIGTLRGLPPATTATQATKSLTMLKGNKEEREIVLDILGQCGILRTRDHPGHADRFVPVEERDDRPNDRVYPVSWRSARDDALRLFLPALAR